MQNLEAFRQPGMAEAWQCVAEQGEVPLVLVRHGRTRMNAERRFVGRLDVPLDEVGRLEARRVGERLTPLPRAALYASPLLRAMETARTLGEPACDAGLMELDQGELEGLDGPTARARFPAFFQLWADDPADARVPGGETLRECQARAVATLQAIAARHEPGPPVVVVSHQMVLATALLHALDLPLRRFRELELGNCSVSVLAVRADRLRVVAVDDRAHLLAAATG